MCAAISGVSHAFIFGMAHRAVRYRIKKMLGMKTNNNVFCVNTVTVARLTSLAK